MSRASADNENGSLFFFFNSNCRLCYFFFSTKKPYHDFHFLFLIRASSGPFCSLFIYLLYPLISFLGKSSFSFCRAGGAGGGEGIRLFSFIFHKCNFNFIFSNRRFQSDLTDHRKLGDRGPPPPAPPPVLSLLRFSIFSLKNNIIFKKTKMILNDGVVSWRQRCRFDGFTVDIFWPKWFSVDGVVSRRQRCRFDCFIHRTFLFFPSFLVLLFFLIYFFHESWETFVVCAARAICSPTTKETLVRRSFNRPPLHTHTHTHTHQKDWT